MTMTARSELTLDDIRPYLVNAKQENGQTVAACPLCEAGNHKGHHLYIKQQGEKLLLYCQKCNAPGQDLIKAFKALGAKPSQRVDNMEKILTEDYNHEYRNPDGSLAYIKRRRKWSDGEKKFTFQWTDAEGRTQFKKPPDCNNLYNLDLMDKASPEMVLYIVEGEKCADSLTKRGLLATTTNTGAQKKVKLSDTDRQYLNKFPNKIFIPDNDDKGHDYTAAWPFTAPVISLPDVWSACPLKGDIADYLGAGQPLEKITNYRFKAPITLDVEYFSGLDKYQIISHEVFEALFSIKTERDRSHTLAVAQIRAQELHCIQQFNRLWKEFLSAKAAEHIVSENTTRFPGQPLTLRCGEWTADINGVHRSKQLPNGNTAPEWASKIPVEPVELLTNVETAQEKIRIAFFKQGRWQHLTCNRSQIANSGRITDLADQGLEVNSTNSKLLVSYLADCVTLNPDIVEQNQSATHLGWIDDKFLPYTDEIKTNVDQAASSLVDSIATKGDLASWIKFVGPLRKNLVLRIVMSAAFASPIIHLVGALPFALLCWGGTGSGKTVAMMVAASIYGCPKFGRLVRTLNMTVNSMLSMASTLYSLPFFGDELQTIKDEFTNYDKLIMQVCEGINRGRLKSDGSQQLQETWNNSFIFTGEEPCTGVVSGGGVRNRVIEIECCAPLIQDGNAVVTWLNNHYGCAGEPYIEALCNEPDLHDMFTIMKKQCMDECDATEKQAAAAALILLGDFIAGKTFWPHEIPLAPIDLKPWLKTAEDVDVAERAYTMVLDWIAENSAKFLSKDVKYTSGGTWGRVFNIDNSVLVNKSVLEREMQEMGFSFNAVKKKWAETGKIELRNDGRYYIRSSVDGKIGSFVKLNLPVT